MPARAPRLDGHVADRHPPFHVEPAHRLAGVLQHRARAAAEAEFGDDGQHHVLGRDASGQGAVDGDAHGARFSLEQRLGRQHMADLAGADAEGERAEGAVGRGVAVAADHGHARLGQPQLRSP